MLRETRAAPGANLIDLHSIRAGLPIGKAGLSQAEALARQALPESAPVTVKVGDPVRYILTGEVGRVTKLLPRNPAVAIIELPSGQLLAWACTIPGEVELPSDCEASA